MLDDGKLVVAHAGLPANMQGRGSGKVRDFALYGDTTGETDEYGLPVRYPWAQEYRGRAMVVYGHTPVPEPEWLNRTICIDTGCVFGGRLTALRYPERELVSVPAAATYYQPAKPFLPPESAGARAHRAAGARRPARHGGRQREADHQDAPRRQRDDPRGERHRRPRVDEPLRRRIRKWLIYLPPTMSPSETTTTPGLLEHPAEAFAYFRGQGVPTVVCEEKHMGSRAVVVVCRDEEVARKRFGVAGRRRRHLLHANRPPVLQRRGARDRRCSRACAPPSTQPTCGGSSRPTGLASTAS